MKLGKQITWLAFSTMLDLKKINKDKEVKRIIRMKATFHSEIIGLKWLISRKQGRLFSPLIDLKHFAN